MRDNENSRFTVSAWEYKPADDSKLSQLKLDIKLGENHISWRSVETKDDIHYSACLMFGEIADAMREQLIADEVPQREWGT